MTEQSEAYRTKIEWLKCSKSAAYFIDNYCFLEDPQIEGAWIPFHLWPEQIEVIETTQASNRIIVLKARQLGLTWVYVAYALWLMIFRASATVLLFSRRDSEAAYMLDHRLKGMYKRLPDWMRAKEELRSSGHELKLSNGSNAMAFPTTAGDSYSATFVLVDEADLIPDLNKLMRAVKPTIDNGGQIALISRVDKTEPNSEFKRIYLASRREENGWASIFLPWYVHPRRDAAWYEEQRRDIFSRTGSYDDLYEQYPATDEEALSPRTLDKRIIPDWVRQCFFETSQVPPNQAISIPNSQFWVLPEPNKKYVIGADPAEGNPNSDDSAAIVLDLETGEEVAIIRGKLEPSTFGYYISLLSEYYNKASVMAERNNHGHALLLWLQDNSNCKLLKGHDKKKGWLSSSVGKNKMYTATAEAMRDRKAKIHSRIVYSQLQSIEGTTLRAPEGDMDDCADAFALAIVGRDKVKSSKILAAAV